MITGPILADDEKLREMIALAKDDMVRCQCDVSQARKTIGYFRTMTAKAERVESDSIAALREAEVHLYRLEGELVFRDPSQF